MTKRHVLLQLDSDPQPSVFDAIVAVDSEVDHLLRHGSVTPEVVRDLVYGAMFTRGPEDLKSTAIFVGGSNVAVAETILAKVLASFFGPIRCSVMFDANGANTTAAAALLVAARHLALGEITALILGATGPVGQRLARLLARVGAKVRVGSRSYHRATVVCNGVRKMVPEADLTAIAIETNKDLKTALEGVQLVIASGAPGVTLLPAEVRVAAKSLQVAIDLNAVPPVGIEGIEITDKGVERNGLIAYGAIGVGGTKMKIHKASIRKLFETNAHLLDAEEIFDLGRELDV